jgi:hypothetical protein
VEYDEVDRRVILCEELLVGDKRKSSFTLERVFFPDKTTHIVGQLFAKNERQAARRAVAAVATMFPNYSIPPNHDNG